MIFWALTVHLHQKKNYEIYKSEIQLSCSSQLDFHQGYKNLK